MAGKAKKKGRGETAIDVEIIPPPPPPGVRKPPKVQKGAEVAIGNIDTIPMPWGRGKKPAKGEPDEAASCAEVPLPVPGRKTKRRARVAPQRHDIDAIPPPWPERKPPKDEKGAQVQWKTEAIPMPIPKGRKPKPSGKK